MTITAHLGGKAPGAVSRESAGHGHLAETHTLLNRSPAWQTRCQAQLAALTCPIAVTKGCKLGRRWPDAHVGLSGFSMQ